MTTILVSLVFRATGRRRQLTQTLVHTSIAPECENIAFLAPAGGGYGGMHGGGDTRVNLSPRMRMADVIKRIEAIAMGGTDCALPML